MVLKGVLRVPASMFDEYRALCFKYPKAMNFYMLYIGMFAVLFAGKGIEKMTMRG
jgi:hypothetical protein